jgi:Asparagine synthase
MSSPSAPPRAPVVCGALGRYDRDRVLRIAAGLGSGCRPVHEDERSILALDREPLRWKGPAQEGLGWIEGLIWDGGARDWEAASRRGACGLVLEGRHRYLHSSISGLGPLYWSADRGCAYFASRIDPLARAAPDPLTIDWDAWASILALRFPAGERTPFAEIRRLEPFSVLGRRWGRFRAHSATWPWTAVEPHLDRESAAEGVVAALREAVAPLDGPAAAPLSGGRDSRIVACLLAERGRASRAMTASDDEGDTFEEDLAAPVAAKLGLEHERLRGSAAEYAASWEERALAVEHQFVDHAWLVPLARRLEGAGTTIGDGIAIDTLLLGGTRFGFPGRPDSRQPRRTSLALFDALRRYGQAHQALSPSLQEPLVARSRGLFLHAASPFEGNPLQTTLTFYRTRTARGVSSYPSGLLGARARVLAPGASDAFALAALATRRDVMGDPIYAAVLDRLDPALGRLPTTSDTPRQPPRLPRLWRSEPALEMHRDLLGDGPLAPHLSAGLRDWLAAPRDRELSPDLRLGMEGVSLFHSWWRRYRDLLRPVDGRELGG